MQMVSQVVGEMAEIQDLHFGSAQGTRLAVFLEERKEELR